MQSQIRALICLKTGLHIVTLKLVIKIASVNSLQVQFGFCAICCHNIATTCLQPREDEGGERIPHTWASSDENYLKSIFSSVSYFVVI